MWETLRVPTADESARYYAAGWWRRQTFLDDLARHARERPGHLAVVGYESGERAAELTYAELARVVERFAAALTGLGVGRGDVVVMYLPNRWMLAPLYLACARIGAVSSPVIPALGGSELAEVLTRSRAKVCVTVDTWNDVDYAGRLADVAPETLRHRVVVGDATRTGAIEFAEFFMRTEWEQRPDTGALPSPAGPDDPVMLIYTSGTSGHMKGVAHSQNTLYAAARAVSDPHGLTADDVISIPNFLTHMAGATYAGWMPAHLGATSIVQDTNTDMALLADLIERHRVTWVYASPSYVTALVPEQQARPRDISSLRCVTSGSAPVQPELVARVREVLGVPLHTLWGMTENGAVTVTRFDDPDGWGARSDGRPSPWMELRIDEVPGADAGRLLVRGASQCLGYVGDRELYDECVDADGWFDTGDMARDDGRGGIRITGRRTDLINRATGQSVSPLALETVLLRHPRIADVAIVGYPDPNLPAADLVCAVVVYDGEPPLLEEIHDFLRDEQIAPPLWPDRVQYVWQLPKNSLGKILRRPLQERLEIAARGRPAAARESVPG